MSYKYFNYCSLIKIVQDHNKTLMVSIHLPVIGALVHCNTCTVSLFNDLSMSSSGLVHLSPEEKEDILRSLSQHPELLRSHHHQLKKTQQQQQQQAPRRPGSEGALQYAGQLAEAETGVSQAHLLNVLEHGTPGPGTLSRSPSLRRISIKSEEQTKKVTMVISHEKTKPERLLSEAFSSEEIV